MKILDFEAGTRIGGFVLHGENRSARAIETAKMASGFVLPLLRCVEQFGRVWNSLAGLGG